LHSNANKKGDKEFDEEEEEGKGTESFEKKVMGEGARAVPRDGHADVKGDGNGAKDIDNEPSDI